jgi:hypothetical protein
MRLAYEESKKGVGNRATEAAVVDVPRFDPTDPQGWFAAWTSSMRSTFPGAFRYEQMDPRVQEIAILATMHNMASLLHNPEPLKAVISSELAQRAAKLAKD